MNLCYWVYNEDHCYYDTRCGKTFCFEEEFKVKDSYRFCPCCGQSIRIVSEMPAPKTVFDGRTIAIPVSTSARMDPNGWQCECGAKPSLYSGDWRWNGKAWEHSHGWPVDHVEAKRIACVEANPSSPATPGKEYDLMPSNDPEPNPEPLTTEAAPSQCDCGQAQTEPPHAVQPCDCGVVKSIGQIAYEAYFQFSEGKSLVSGAPLPEWSATQPIIQRAWEAVAIAIVATPKPKTPTPCETEKDALPEDVLSSIRMDKNLRKDLDKTLQWMKALEPSRELALSITKVQEAIMWLGMDLKRLGAPNPYPHSYDPSSPVVEPTADGLKL